MKKQHNLEPKPLFLERMHELLPEEKDFESYMKILQQEPVRSIRCNTLKISPEKLKARLEKDYKWKVSQPFPENKEIMIVESELKPGELGRALEHVLGYYYIQEIASMLPVLALKPKPDDFVLDMCASPGSKTTQIAATMGNTGTIIANEVSLGRIKILASNLERCGVTNALITKKDGSLLLRKFQELNYKFDKILVDAPCSGEGTLRSSPKTYRMWNIHTIRKLSKVQRNLVSAAIELLAPGGEMVYSTCTHAPEENEAIVDFVLKNFPEMEIEKITLPINPRQGLTKWQEKEYVEDVKYACRIYPQDNNTEGFFIAKFRKKK